MTRLTTLAAALAASTLLAGAAVAADQSAEPNQAAPHATATPMTAPQRRADSEAGQLSADGAAAYRDVHLARLAIYEAKPEQARMFVSHAQSALEKAKTDSTAFTKAEADLKPPSGMAGPAPTAGGAPKADAAPGPAGAKDANKDANNDAKSAEAAQPAQAGGAPATQPVTWLPVDAQLVLADDFVARSKDQSKAIDEANQHLQKGDRQGAVGRLKLAGVDVDFTMAVVPLAKTTQEVDQAAKLIADGQYYQANVALKQAEDGVRFDVIDATAVPKVAAAPKPVASGTTGSTAGSAAKPAAH
jgi:hypothetical protein